MCLSYAISPFQVKKQARQNGGSACCLQIVNCTVANAAKWNVIYRTLPFYSVRTNMQVKMGLPKRKAHCMVLLILR